MDLGPSEVQLVLKNNARRFLQGVSTPEHVRRMEESTEGYDKEVWNQMCDQGWPGLLIPDAYGGQDGDVSDMVVLFEEIGHFLAPSPLFASSVLGALTVLELGSEDQKKAILPDVANGTKLLTLALTEKSGTYESWGIETTAKKDGDSYTLNGTKVYVPYAQVADTIIVVARTGEGDDNIAFFLVDRGTSGVRTTILHTIGADHQYVLDLENVKVDAANVLGSATGGWSKIDNVLQAATVVFSAEAIGGAERSLELAVDYSKQRIAFGRPIGAFQALQHKMARMMAELTGGQLAVYEAAYKLANNEDSTLDVSLAKVAANMAYSTCSIEACHIFGGAGFVRGSEMELFYRRALGSETLLGTPRWHKKRIARLLSSQASEFVHAHAH